MKFWLVILFILCSAGAQAAFEAQAGARSAGMAGADLGRGTLDAVFSDESQPPQLGVSGGIAQGRSLYSVAGVLALQEDFRFGIGWQSLSDSRLRLLREDTLAISAGLEIAPALNLGVRAKLHQLSAVQLPEQVSGLSYDLGVLREQMRAAWIPGNFSLAFDAKNVAGSWPSSWGESIPLQLSLGLLYRPTAGLILAGSGGWAEAAPSSWSLGAEWKAFSRLDLRAGWKNESRPQASAGLGTSFAFLNARMDYAVAWRANESLGHRLSIEMGLPRMGSAVDVRPLQVLRDPDSGEIQKVLFGASIDATLGVKAWRIEIRGPGGGLLRSLESPNPQDRELAWDGMDSQGKQVEATLELSFILHLELLDGASLKSASHSLDRFIKKEAMAATAAPVSASSKSLPRLKPVFEKEGSTRLSMVVLEMPEAQKDVARWKVEFTDSHRELLRRLQGEGALPKELVWDGKDEKGQLVKDALDVQVRTELEDSAGQKQQQELPLFSQAAYAIAAKELKSRPELALAALGMNLKLERPVLGAGDETILRMAEMALDRQARSRAADMVSSAAGAADLSATGHNAWFFDLFDIDASQILPAREARLKPLLLRLEGRQGLTLVVSGSSMASEKDPTSLAMRRAQALVSRLHAYGAYGVQFELQSPLQGTESRGVRVEIR